mmetsp:Transcript_64629/g.138457  ORF Transcript_64629/g.138457 Transcript_64629/m.138457 type:complete len:81 (-) Transcript_64629:114-356(-)
MGWSGSKLELDWCVGMRLKAHGDCLEARSNGDDPFLLRLPAEAENHGGVVEAEAGAGGPVPVAAAPGAPPIFSGPPAAGA